MESPPDHRFSSVAWWLGSLLSLRIESFDIGRITVRAVRLFEDDPIGELPIAVPTAIAGPIGAVGAERVSEGL
jgi:hypothetical protein